MAIISDVIAGIVLLNRPYKENDALVTVLGEDGVKTTFKAQGIMRLTSKNAPSCQILNIGEYDFIPAKGQYKTLKSGKLIRSFKVFFSSFEASIVAILLAETLDKLTYDGESNPQFYKVMEASLVALDNLSSPLAVLTTALIQLLKTAGHGLVTDSCCCCGTRNNIISIDLAEGGFICEKCFQPGQLRFSVKFLKQVRTYMLTPLDNPPDGWPLFFSSFLPLVLEHLQDNCGIHLRSANYLKKLL